MAVSFVSTIHVDGRRKNDKAGRKIIKGNAVNVK
jgi:hypothetical protein